ncbi:glycosyltransferase [Agrilactobacillus composti DSM 18527 = JCM 14202]|nr:glycosyltransferase [Agrilactobacillus composti DSM 18527 = JCM 14202]
MKLLSIIVPCYNSENYMERAINSALLGGQAVEIVIVDDGSSDKTPEIADHYAQYFPEVVQTVHQKNGGPGEASTLVFAMPRASILKSWTVTIGWISVAFNKFSISCGNLKAMTKPLIY